LSEPSSKFQQIGEVDLNRRGKRLT
jgi:hypothetical protein